MKWPSSAIALALMLGASTAAAQPDPTPSDPTPPSDDPSPPPPSPPPIAPPADPVLDPPSSPSVSEPKEERRPAMSEGRLLVSLYNSGFQWGISPGVAFANGKAGFLLGLNFGYGFDTGPVILVPGVRFTGYFLDPFVFIGMPTFKVVLPIDRFAPFIEGGVGPGYVDQKPNSPDSKAGVALMGGGGFMVHFSPSFAAGVHASYQVITGTGFEGFGIGPILAIGF